MRPSLHSLLLRIGGGVAAFTCFALVSVPVRAQQGAQPGAAGILIGSSLPLDGSFSTVGQETKEGIEAALRVVNDQGGIYGKRLNLVTCSDAYDPLLCVQNTLQLINADKVFALCSYVGTPTSLKAQPVWQGAKVPVVGFYTGAKALREPFNRYNIHVRASYAQETRAAVEAFTGKLQARKFAILYQDDSFGEAVKTATETALAEKKLAPVALGKFVRSTLNVEEALDRIVPTAPDVVVMVGTYAPLAKVIRLAKARGLKKTIFYTVSFVGPEALASDLPPDVDHVVVSEVVPLYSDIKRPMVAAYLAAMRGRAPSFPSFEGYLNARVLIEGLKRAGENPTREAFIDAVETIGPDQIEPGCPIAYGPTNHEGLHRVYLISLERGQWGEVEDWTKLR